ncbi:MAG: hypothetical protein CBC29_03325 [Methylococcaceae bacterium TMED69]|nr:MAG: hypothetical protein CBC29_03325 [Methylococcaceae bacterium TMED69]|tara:strand:- start:3917 stop:5362 length:1446 start_codon:yes stop_codon:yes gene_type:complete
MDIESLIFLISFVLKISGSIMKNYSLVGKRKNLTTTLGFLISLLLLNSGCTDNNTRTTKEYRLKNGLKLIVQPDRRSPVVINQIWYKVGSVYEPSGITGISHFLEHLMFKGTKNLKEGEFSKIVASGGGNENAFTSFDYTGYYQKWGKQNLETSLRLEAERMTNLLFSDESVEKERQVVLEERTLRVDDSPKGMAYEKLRQLAYSGTTYGSSIIGSIKDISSISIKDLKNWYSRYYHPNNATIVIVGDVDPDTTFALVKKYFDAIPSAQQTSFSSKINITNRPTQSDHTIVTDKAKTPYLIMGYMVPGLVQQKSDEGVAEWEPYALDVLATILDGYQGARLESNIIRSKGLATTASASYSMTRLIPSLFTLSATPKDGIDIVDLRDGLIDEIEKIKQTPPDQVELGKVIAQTLANSIFQKDSVAYQGIILGSLDAAGLDWRLNDGYFEKIKQITPDNVSYVAKKYFDKDFLTTVMLKPKGT